jgi:adenylate kinase
LLAEKLRINLISVSNLVKKDSLFIGYDTERNTFIADIEEISKVLREKISCTKKNLIIESHFVSDVVQSSKANLVFVLRRDPRELEHIFRNRGYKEKKIAENIAAEILDVCLFDAIKIFGVEKVCEINVTGKKPNFVVEEIILVINGKKDNKIGIVDWIWTLENEGVLKKYLKNF